MSVRRYRPYLIAFALSLGITVSNGFARFAYGLIVPSMRADLDWTYTQAGWLNTANGIGYLIGSLLTFVLVRRMSPARIFQIGLLVSAGAVLAMGTVRDVATLSALRILSGVAGAPVFICGSVLVSAVFVHAPDRARITNGLFFGGAGLGLVLSGVAIPALLETLGARAWPQAWLMLGLLSLVLMPFAMWGSTSVHAAPQTSGGTTWPWLRYMPAFFAYAAFGAGYIVYMTFVVTWATESGANVVSVMALWTTLGLATLAAPFFWSPLRETLTGARPIAATLFATAAGTTIALLGTSLPYLVVSATIFGFGFFMVPGAITELTRQSLPREAWALALSAFTIVFAIAQMCGPILAGWIADRTNDLSAGLLAAAAFMLVGALAALLQRTPAPAELDVVIDR